MKHIWFYRTRVPLILRCPFKSSQFYFATLKYTIVIRKEKKNKNPKKKPKSLLDVGSLFIVFYKYTFNAENGGFAPDKSRGPKAPRDLSGVKPTFEVFNRLKT